MALENQLKPMKETLKTVCACLVYGTLIGMLIEIVIPDRKAKTPDALSSLANPANWRIVRSDQDGLFRVEGRVTGSTWTPSPGEYKTLAEAQTARDAKIDWIKRGCPADDVHTWTVVNPSPANRNQEGFGAVKTNPAPVFQVRSIDGVAVSSPGALYMPADEPQATRYSFIFTSGDIEGLLTVTNQINHDLRKPPEGVEYRASDGTVWHPAWYPEWPSKPPTRIFVE